MNTLLQSASFQELLTIMLSALGCGLLTGLERERNKNPPNEPNFAGLRSFTIVALLGATCFSLHLYVGVIGTIAVCLFCLYSLFQQKQDIGSTTELAFLMTYLIGGICVWNINLAVSMAVLLTIILISKSSLHYFAEKILKNYEIRDGLFLLALILIALPVMPNRALWENILNPHVIFKLLILILVIQSIAHIAKRLLPNDKAIILSALASGFVSSTATIASLGMQVRSEKANPKLNASAALISCISTLIQLLLIVLGVSVAWFNFFIIPTLCGIFVLAIAAGFLFYTSPKTIITSNSEIKINHERMFSIKEALIVAVILTLIQVIIYGANLIMGDNGLILGTFLASLFEIHAAIAGVIIQGDIHNITLVYAIVIGLIAHAIAKNINAFITGGFKFFLYFAPIQIIHMLIVVFLIFYFL